MSSVLRPEFQGDCSKTVGEIDFPERFSEKAIENRARNTISQQR